MYWLVINAQAGGHIDIGEDTSAGVDWGSVLGGAASVVGLLVLVVGVFFAFRLFKPRDGKPSAAPSGMGLETRRKIMEAKESGDFEIAGDLLWKAGEHAEAADSYVRAKALEKAARAFHESGNNAQAIRYYKQSGDMTKAAKIYADTGQHMAAAAEYMRADAFEKAAEQYALADDFKRAAEAFERAKQHLKAGEYYEKGEAYILAAENYALYFDDALSKASGDLQAVSKIRPLAKKAGEFYRDEGDLERASHILQQAGYFEEAARCLRTTGDLTRAAEMLMKAKQPLLAAEVLEEAGDDQRAARMRAEAAMKDKDYATAAEMFRNAGEYKKALKIYEKLEDWGNSGEILEKLGDQKNAFDRYVKADMHAHAARCAELLDKPERAAELYRKAGDVDGELRALLKVGDFFRAGRLQFEHRRYDDSLASLSKIDSRDPIHPRALELQGDVLQAQGRFEKAYSRYRAAMGNREVAEATLPLVYKMGRMLEEEQDRNGALEHFNSILSVDKNFEDVSLRVKQLLGRRKSNTIPGVSSSGIFSAPPGEDGAPGERYEIIDEIARGGMGIVYKARDTVLGRVVAYKILGENLRDNETAVKYFLREARAAAALSHPNIVTIFDAGEQTGDYYMAMEFVEGTTLKELIKRKGALPEEQVRYILIHCCKALQYAHSKGIIHRDIKSGNVMITRDKALKIMDFGLAKFMREYQKEHTQQVGTPFYMSPEQIIGKNIDFRSDLYSLGCTIFECATGTVPFFKGDLSYHHVHTKPPSPRSINPALSRGLERIILKTLEKKPDHRYQTAKDIIDAVSGLKD